MSFCPKRPQGILLSLYSLLPTVMGFKYGQVLFFFHLPVFLLSVCSVPGSHPYSYSRIKQTNTDQASDVRKEIF